VISLGQRRSEQDYSSDDRGLLSNLASQASPAVRVAQLVRQQQIEAQARERIEQELRVARLIQQTLLPKELPTPAGWQVAAHYQPAQAVGGDFYDFIYLADGRLAIIIGDVTDKGVPAALVMATTRSILRGASEQFSSPGQILEQANNRLCPDIPAKMFVTCLYAVLDPATGRLHYANAGHDVPYCRTASGVIEMRATGMPLGLLPGMNYEEREILLGDGDSVLFYSDGIVEAHNPAREMFGFPRLASLIGQHPGGEALVGYLLDELATFTGSGWEQEDDTTMVLIQRQSVHPRRNASQVEGYGQGGGREDRSLKADNWRLITQFQLPSEPGNERDAMKRVADAIRDLNLPATRLEKLKTAVAEATMNAIEHGNKNRADLPVDIRVLRDEGAEAGAAAGAIAVQITDHGGGQPVPEPATPDLDAKLAGLQSPRGWGLFLIGKMVDEMNTASDDVHHTVELIMNLGGDHGNTTTI
jgi:serine phosphatase RsbU (regulator of sigma subunit)/anti-sigma regulatory factor (Ser/Thr protein kinase)